MNEFIYVVLSVCIGYVIIGTTLLSLVILDMWITKKTECFKHQ
jgi:hypothetical protein